MSEQRSAADEHRIFGQAIRALRANAGLTQEALSARVGISARYLSEIENGRRGARWHTVIRLLHAFDTDLRGLADTIEQAEATPHDERA